MKSEAPAIGETLGERYRVIGTLGEGGMGIVLEVEHMQLGTRFAAKLPTMKLDELSGERFLREAKAAANLKSEHVARVTDYGTLADGRPFQVLDKLEGATLEQLFDSGSLALEEIVDAVAQAASGLAEAHAAGIVHRDIKPSNLFRTQRVDGTPCTKVLDFGISKVASTPLDAPGTATETVLGTPFFMAPEQIRSTKSVDRRVDIWSLGVVLYQGLTQRLPFVDESVAAVIAKILEQTPKPVTSGRFDVPPDLAAIVTDCLAKDPLRRPQTMGDLARRLAPFGSVEARTAAERARMVVVRAQERERLSLPGGSLAMAETADASVLASTPPGVGRNRLLWVFAAAFGVLIVAAVLQMRKTTTDTAIGKTPSATPVATNSGGATPAPEVNPAPPTVAPAATSSVSATSAIATPPQPSPVRGTSAPLPQPTAATPPSLH